MRIPNETLSKVNSAFMAWADYIMKDHDELLARNSMFDMVNNGKKPKNAAPRARKHAKWIKTSSTRNRPGAISINYKSNPEMALMDTHISNKLGRLYQHIIIYKYIEGMSYAQIGTEIGKSEDTVKHYFNDIYLYFAGLLQCSMVDY